MDDIKIPKWEYTIIESLSSKSDLNGLGKKGWEAISVNNGKMYFKRACGTVKLRPIEPEQAKEKKNHWEKGGMER